VTAPVLSIQVLLPVLHTGVGLLLGAWTLLFLFRIVLTWYPQIDLSQGVMRLIGAPTDFPLALTRRLIAPIGGVDVTPVVWVGLVSLVRELLVGQQGLLTLALLRSQSLA
jgi:YggT family protein